MVRPPPLLVSLLLPAPASPSKPDPRTEANPRGPDPRRPRRALGVPENRTGDQGRPGEAASVQEVQVLVRLDGAEGAHTFKELFPREASGWEHKTNYETA